MNLFFLEALNTLGTNTLPGEAVGSLVSNPAALISGIVLIIAAVLIFWFLKNIVVHAVVGIIGWAIAVFVFHIELPFVLSLIVSLIFGLGGLGVLLLLKFLGII
ncbi:MAG: hypothetical protein Q7S21_06060 [archaeon]|nr:hypothetical protein [archaeon]